MPRSLEEMAAHLSRWIETWGPEGNFPRSCVEEWREAVKTDAVAAITALIGLTRDSNPTVRLGAVIVVSTLACWDGLVQMALVLPAMVDLLADPEIGSNEGISYAIEGIAMSVLMTQEMPDQKLEDSKPLEVAVIRRAFPALFDYLTGDSSTLCRYHGGLKISLCLLGDEAKEFVPRLLGLLQHPVPRVRSWSAEILSELNYLSPEFLPALIACAGDANHKVRGSVALAIGAVTRSWQISGHAEFDECAVATLTALLHDPEKFVQIAAEDALEMIGRR